MLDNELRSPTIPTAEQAKLPEGESPLPTSNISTDNNEPKQFDVTDSKEAAQDALRRGLTVYVLQKNSSDKSDILGLKNHMQAMRLKSASKSNIVYWQILDAPSENKDTLISIIQDLQCTSMLYYWIKKNTCDN